jgi:hypothetical protein
METMKELYFFDYLKYLIRINSWKPVHKKDFLRYILRNIHIRRFVGFFFTITVIYSVLIPDVDFGNNDKQMTSIMKTIHTCEEINNETSIDCRRSNWI